MRLFVQGPEPTRKGTGEVAAPTKGLTPADQNSPAQTPDQPPRAPPLMRQPSTQNLADDDPNVHARGEETPGTRERPRVVAFQQVDL